MAGSQVAERFRGGGVRAVEITLSALLVVAAVWVAAAVCFLIAASVLRVLGWVA